MNGQRPIPPELVGTGIDLEDTSGPFIRVARSLRVGQGFAWIDTTQVLRVEQDDVAGGPPRGPSGTWVFFGNGAPELFIPRADATKLLERIVAVRYRWAGIVAAANAHELRGAVEELAQ